MQKQKFIQSKMLKSIFFIGLLCIVSPILVPKDENQPLLFTSDLQFDNYTGVGVGTTMSENFLEAIRKGYLFHRDNMKDNIQYIRSQLERIYSKGFTVAIFDKNTTAGIYAYSHYGDSFVVWSNVNSQNPNWVYVIIMLDFFYGNDYGAIYGQGSGIDASKVTMINNIIATAEKKWPTLLNYRVLQINYSLKQYDGKDWTVIVAKRFAYIYASINCNNHQFIIPSWTVNQTYLIYTHSD